MDQTETRQFKRWFGDSKVVDRDGEPLVVYHGTSEKNGDFFIFDSSKAKKKGGLGLAALGKGNYFTSERLTGNERYGKRVIQTFLRIENPFVYEGGESFREQVAKKIDKNAMTMTQEEIQEVMRSKGYDGVIQYDSSGKPNVAVAFDSNQIKSATDNVGTFANIRYFVSLCRNGLSAAPKHPSLRYFCPVPTQATAEQSGDRQRRGKGSPILMAEKGEHERVPRAGESYPTPLRATLRAPTSKWAVEAFFRRVSAASRGRGQPRRGYRRPKPTARSDVGRLRSRRAAGFLLHTFLSPPKEKCERPMGR